MDSIRVVLDASLSPRITFNPALKFIVSFSMRRKFVRVNDLSIVFLSLANV